MLIIRNVDDVLIILRSVSALFAWGWSVSSAVGSPLLFTIGVVACHHHHHIKTHHHHHLHCFRQYGPHHNIPIHHHSHHNSQCTHFSTSSSDISACPYPPRLSHGHRMVKANTTFTGLTSKLVLYLYPSKSQVDLNHILLSFQDDQQL